MWQTCLPHFLKYAITASHVVKRDIAALPTSTEGHPGEVGSLYPCENVNRQESGEETLK